MALAGRSARRGAAGTRWIAVGLVITLFVLLIDASINSRSTGPVQQLAAGAWFDRALPIITTSTEEGQTVASIWTNGLSTPAASLASEINGVVTGSATAYAQAIRLRPPTNLSGQAGLLVACLLARSQGAEALKQAFQETLGAAYPAATTTGSKKAATTTTTTTVPAAAGDPLAAPVQALSTAAARMEIGDQAYQLFASDVPASLGLKIPASVWLASSAPYQAQTAQVFLTSLQSSVSTTPVYAVKVYALSTDPPPVNMQGTTAVLPVVSDITLTLVVANVGNQPEDNLTVVAALSPVGGGAGSVRDFVNLEPGQAHTIANFGPLNPPQGVPVTLTVTVTSPDSPQTATVTVPYVFEMGASPPPTTVATGSPPTT
jgi:hypothetical protein